MEQVTIYQVLEVISKKLNGTGSTITAPQSGPHEDSFEFIYEGSSMCGDINVSIEDNLLVIDPSISGFVEHFELELTDGWENEVNLWMDDYIEFEREEMDKMYG